MSYKRCVMTYCTFQRHIILNAADVFKASFYIAAAAKIAVMPGLSYKFTGRKHIFPSTVSDFLIYIRLRFTKQIAL